MLVTEVTIKISNEEKTLKKKRLHEGVVTVSLNDPFIQEWINEAIKDFQADHDDLMVLTKTTIP